MPKKCSKTLKRFATNFQLLRSSKYQTNIIVITKATNTLHMVIPISLINIEEEQNLDRATAKQLAKIIDFLLNIED